MFVASWLWILVLSLIALSVSAWVKWKPLASGGLIAIFMVGAGMGTMINELLDARWGLLLNVPLLVQTVWEHLFDRTPSIDMPLWLLWATLTLVAGVCLFLLDRKLRAYEVTT